MGMRPALDRESARSDKFLRDPVHDYIRILTPLIGLTRSAYLQRLRNVSQNSRAMAAYPSLNGSRFEHALGTMELATRAWRSAWVNSWGPSPEDYSHDVQHQFMVDVKNGILDKFKDAPELFPMDPWRNLMSKNKSSKDKAHEEFEKRFIELMDVAIGAVGLLHDIGHPPFSHILEDGFSQYADQILGEGSSESFLDYKREVGDGKRAQFHEWAGREITRRILLSPVASGLPAMLIWEIFTARRGQSWASAIHEIIDEEIDVDRLDYICRDSLRAGVDYHAMDTSRLLANIELHRKAEGEWQVGIGQGAISAVESLLMQRDQSYRWMIFHQKAILADTAMKRAFDMALAYESGQGGDLNEFDYIGRWDPPASVAGMTAGHSYRVDDHYVLDWLRDLRLRIGGQEGATFQLLMEIADLFTPSTLAVWRNYGDLVAALDEVGDRLDPVLLRTAEASNANGEDVELSEDGRASLSINSEESSLTQISAAAVSPRRASMFAQLLRDIWKGNALLGVEPMLDLDVTIEAYLNEHASEIEGVEGHWLVAHRLKFDPIKVASKRGVASGLMVWAGTKAVPFKELSPVYDGLMRSNSRRPVLWAFWAPFAVESAVTRDSVKQVFLEKLVDFLSVQAERVYCANNGAV